MATSIHGRFFNSGRASASVVHAALTQACRGNADFYAFNEIGEADHGYDEHAWLSSLLYSFDSAGTTSPEPIYAHHFLKVTAKRRVIGGSVPGQTRRRGWTELVIAGEPDTLVLSTHCAAGYLNGAHSKRSGATRALVGKVSYIPHRIALRRRIRVAHKLGQHVILCGDLNTPKLWRVHPDQHVVVNAGPDYVVAVPAHGYRARSQSSSIPAFEPEHPIHNFRVTFSGASDGN